MFDWESGDEDKRKSLESWQQTFSMPSACWGCELFSTMARVTLGFGTIGEDIFAGPAIAAMNAFMGLWVVWQLYLLLSPSNRSEEHTSELQSLMRNSSAVFCFHTKHSATTI